MIALLSRNLIVCQLCDRDYSEMGKIHKELWCDLKLYLNKNKLHFYLTEICSITTLFMHPGGSKQAVVVRTENDSTLAFFAKASEEFQQHQHQKHFKLRPTRNFLTDGHIEKLLIFQASWALPEQVRYPWLTMLHRKTCHNFRSAQAKDGSVAISTFGIGGERGIYSFDWLLAGASID